MPVPDDAFVIARRIAAPRERVFRAWTEADHLQRWFGPKGSSMHIAALEFHPGGRFHYALDMPGGMRIWGLLRFREIVAPERLVQIQSFSDAQGGITRNPWSAEWPLEVLATTVFAEKDGGTLITQTARPHEAGEAERRIYQAAFASMTGGWNGSFDKLAAYLAQP